MLRKGSEQLSDSMKLREPHLNMRPDVIANSVRLSRLTDRVLDSMGLLQLELL
jgi:hypothetical protein